MFCINDYFDKHRHCGVRVGMLKTEQTKHKSLFKWIDPKEFRLFMFVGVPNEKVLLRLFLIANGRCF